MTDIKKYLNGEISWCVKNFPNIIDESGSLGVIEYGQQLDFVVKRVFFLRDVLHDSIRGKHAHKMLEQVIVCLSGSFTIDLDNGLEKCSIKMKADDNCLYVDGRVWREMRDFSDHTVMMVLCDREYRFDEVIRDYSLFKENLQGVNNAL